MTLPHDIARCATDDCPLAAENAALAERLSAAQGDRHLAIASANAARADREALVARVAELEAHIAANCRICNGTEHRPTAGWYSDRIGETCDHALKGSTP